MVLPGKYLILLFVYVQLSKAVIDLPSFGNRTYVPPGDNVTISWNFTEDIGNVVLRKWLYLKDSSSSAQQLYSISSDGDPAITSSNPFKNTEVQKPASLILRNVTMGNNGTYRFEITVNPGNNPPKSKVEVIVTEQPVANVSCSSQLVVNERGNISCVCSSIGGNPPATASWLRNGKKINGTGYLKKSLMLTNVSKNDKGVYKCMVKSHDLTNETSVNITVRYSPKNISFKVEGANENYVEQNTKVTLKCHADAYPAANYSIFHDNTAKITNNFTGEYVIDSVNSSHVGQYRCEAKNVVGTQTSYLTLDVKERPTAMASCSPTNTVEEGENVKCVCTSIGGNPLPKASWYKDGKQISGPTLWLNNTKRTDKGTYVCKVESLDLFDEYNVIVVVTYLPEDISFKVKGASGNYVNQNSEVTLKCQADAYPAATYSIFYDNTTIITNDSKGEYDIKSVNSSHAGRYRCEAKNVVGTQTSNLTLAVKEQPTANASCSPTNTVAEGENVKCVCTSIGGNPPPNASWYKDGNRISGPTLWLNNVNKTDNGGTYVCKVESLDLFDEYNVTVVVIFDTTFPSEPVVEDGLSGGAIAGIVIGVLLFLIILIILIVRCYCPHVCKKEKSGERYRGDIVIDNNSATYNYTPGGMAENPYESPDGKTNDGASNSSSSRPSTGAPTSTHGAADMPPVYSVVDKSRIPKKTKEPKKEEDPNQLTYASLDPVALQPDSSRMHPREKPESNYAQIDLGKL